MRHEQIEGQLSLFEEPKILFFEEKKDELINPIFEKLIKRYRNTCTRIAKVENKLYVEIDNQIKTLRKIQTDKIIKRKGDNNILIQYDNFCIAIYPSGHFAKWKSPAVYSDNEVYSIDEIENLNKIYEDVVKDPAEEEIMSEEDLHLGDKVSFDYDGQQVGEIVRIYNNGETVNVCWNNKQTAFYYKHVYKITG